MMLFKAGLAVFQKDLKLEFRSRYGFNTILAFVISSLMVLLFALGADDLPPQAQSGLIWIIILFAAMAALQRSFVGEADMGTFDTLRLRFAPATVFAGKLVYNFLFTLMVSVFTLILYLFLMNIQIAVWGVMIVILFLGSLGLASVSTLLASLVAQSSQKGAIFSVLSIPLLIPLILILAKTTQAGFFGITDGGIANDLMALFGYCGVTITAGSLLFDFVWEE